MENCPYCGAPGSFREAVDGCCYVCGMVLPDVPNGTRPPEAADSNVTVPGFPPVASAAPAEPTKLEASPAAAPPAQSQVATVELGDELPPIQLIKPRNLAPEYARRVTAAWQATKSPFQNPQETLNSSSSSTADPDNLQIGTRSLSNVTEVSEKRSDYELTEVIGEGNMGTVWSARQASLDREVAIKIPKHSAGGSTIGRRMFISEVVVTGQLDHPNIVPIYDLARDELGHLFYAMKRVDGRPWDNCIHEEGRTRQDNLEALMKVCDAIRFAHDRGVIHRDIKPQNIMIGKYGEVSVMDWGIALRLDTETGTSNVTKLSPAGTPAYMAPEMATANAGELGPHTDVYLLGAVLYEIITGQPPHPPPKDSHDRKVQQNACLIIAARNVIMPTEETGELIDIAYKAMATDFSLRYQTVAEFQDAIRSYFSHADSIALTDSGYAHLAGAEQRLHRGYEDYSKARFAFGEALELWPENNRARFGLLNATRANAGVALAEGDYAFGLSLLNGDDPEHADLIKELKSGKRRQARNRFVAIASATAAAGSLLLGIAASLYFLNREQQAKENLEVANKSLTKTTENLEVANKSLTKTTEQLNEQNGKLSQLNIDLGKSESDLQKANTRIREQYDDLERSNAVLATQVEKTRLAQRETERASYQSEIGVAAGAVDRNAFGAAQFILAKLTSNDTQKLLRNWEWGYLQYSANDPSIARFILPKQSRVTAVAMSPDQKWIAAGTEDGDVVIWLQAEPRKPFRIKQDAPVSSLAISMDNSGLQLIAVAAGGKIQFFTLPLDNDPQAVKEIGDALSYPPGRIVSVTFAPRDVSTVLTSATDSTAQVWSRREPGSPRIIRASVSGPVWQARFSPNGRQIVTAGDDETVRVWDTSNEKKERSKLLGHRGPVYAAEFSPDGGSVVSGGRDRRLLVWDLRSADAPKSPKEVIENRLIETNELDEGGRHSQTGEHTAAIHSIAFSPKGDLLYSASDDNSVKVWDVRSGIADAKLLRSLRGHGGWVRACASGADQRHVLSGAYDGRVYLWDWPNYSYPRVLKPTSDRPSAEMRLMAATCSADARWIATATEDGVVTMWDMQNPAIPRPQLLKEGHDWQATTAIYFDRGNRLLTAGGDNSAVVWDAQLGNQLVRLGGWNVAQGTGWRGVAAAAHHGRWIATGSTDSNGKPDRTTISKIWEAQSGRPVVSLEVGRAASARANENPEATALAFSSDDQSVFVGDQAGNGYLFDPATGSSQSKFKAHDAKISAAAFMADGRLLTASSDRTVKKWTVLPPPNEPQLVATFLHQGRVVAMDVSQDGRQIITAADPDDSEAVVRLWNVESGEIIAKISEGELERTQGGRRLVGEKRTSVRSVALHPVEPHALITIFDPRLSSEEANVICRWEWKQKNVAPALQPIWSRQTDTAMAVYAPDPSGAILTVGGRGARLRLANRTLMSYRPQPSALSVSFSPDNTLLAVAGGDGSVKIWRCDQATGHWTPERKLMGGHSGPVRSVAFHPASSDTLLTASDDRTVKIWKRAGGDWNVATTLEGHKLPVRQAIFARLSRGGEPEIVTASDDGDVRIWNSDGKLIDKLATGAAATCIAGSADGKWIVAGVGHDAFVWNRAELQQPPRKLIGHSAEVTSLVFSPDSERLFTASQDFSIKLWDAQAWAAGATDQREILTLEQHTDSVTSIAFFSNNILPSLLSAGADGQAILWPSTKVSE